MTQQSAIVVVIDRLGAGFLGPYGNTWIDTPRINRLACQSFLFENLMADSADLDSLYQSYWQGRHALCPADPHDASLAQRLKDAGVSTTLVTDEPRVASHVLADAFRHRIVVPSPAIAAPAADIGDTHIARVFASVVDCLDGDSSPQLLWIHARAMACEWDAPEDFRRQFADEDDPIAPSFVDPPNRMLDENYDPDELLGIAHAYAGQIVAVDLLLGALLDALEAAGLFEQALLIFTSPRGYPLGEHRRIGPLHEALYSELLASPLLIRMPERMSACERSHALVQPPDLFATLADWFGVGHAEPSLVAQSLQPIVRGNKETIRSVACAASGSQFALRTTAWFMLTGPMNHQLFVKPDDRWEVNDVANRCADVVAEMLRTLDEFRQCCQTGRSQLEPLSGLLRDGLE